MEADRNYRIAFKGLKNGIHPFSFHTGDNFFRSLEHSSIRRGDIEVNIMLDKRDSMIILEMDASGTIEDACDRCLSQIDIPLVFKEQIVIQFDDEERDEEEIIYIDPKRNYLELRNIIYQLIHVNRPTRNIRDCEAEGNIHCDPEVLLKMGDEKGPVEKDEIRDIWEELKKLNF